jgi:hypothetical protein
MHMMSGEWRYRCLMVSNVIATLVIVLVVLLVKKLVICNSLMAIGEKSGAYSG